MSMFWYTYVVEKQFLRNTVQNNTKQVFKVIVYVVTLRCVLESVFRWWRDSVGLGCIAGTCCGLYDSYKFI